MIAIVIGVRPHYTKLAGFYEQLIERCPVSILDTGQHVDPALSSDLAREFGLPDPAVRLRAAGSGISQIAESLVAVHGALQEMGPDRVVVIGDANTALVGGLAAAKLEIPLAHVEAGIRNREVGLTEETNRRIIDSVADLHLAPSRTAYENLIREGHEATSEFVGDLLRDVRVAQDAEIRSASNDWRSTFRDVGDATTVTIHRSSTLASPTLLRRIVDVFIESDRPSIWVLHPGTRSKLAAYGELERLEGAEHVTVLGALEHRDLLGLMAACRQVVSDSNGVQREAFYVGTPLIVLRPGTEYPETIDLGRARVIHPSEFTTADLDHAFGAEPDEADIAHLLGDATAGDRIAESLARWHARSLVPA